MPPVNPIPDDYPRLCPYLIVDGAEDAIAFYAEVLGTEERMRLPGSDGRIGHAELQLGDSVLMLADEFPDMGIVGPKAGERSPVAMTVYVEDVDATFARALGAGATEITPLEDKFYGDRTGQFEDPFGHRWNVMTHIEDVTSEELAERASAAADASA